MNEKNFIVEGYLITMNVTNSTNKITGEAKSYINNLYVLVGCDDVDDLSGKVLKPKIDIACNFVPCEFESAERFTPVQMVLTPTDDFGNYLLKSISVKG